MSENSASKVDETYANTLAKEASVLNHVKEIHLETKTTLPKPTTLVTQPPAALNLNEVKNLSSVFQDKSEIVDPIKEKEFLMKINAVDESDTEGFMNVERPILGKVSLMRRAKSAVSRSIIERRINDKHPLFTVAWEHQKHPSKSGTGQDSQTININVDDDEPGSDDDIPTPEEVKRHMELFHLRRGQPPPSAKLEECRKTKHSKSRSSKTKSNRYGNFINIPSRHIFLKHFIVEFTALHQLMMIWNHLLLRKNRVEHVQPNIEVKRMMILRLIHSNRGAPKIY